jgi:hypothetical protein
MLYFIRSVEDTTLQQEAPQMKAKWMAQIEIHEPIGGSKQLLLADLCTQEAEAPQHKFEYNIHLLKSNLQKTFRRQLWQPCLATLLQMIYQDPIETLRRLAVILLEDSLLYPHLYNKIIWLQFATGKGYRLSKLDVQTIVDAVATGLESASRYNLALSADTTAAPSSFWLRDPAQREAYIGPRLRSLAGGMKFDTKFLHVLAQRALTSDLPLETEYTSVGVEDVEEFSPAEHMIPESIDFHCCPQILKDLPYKDAIWWHWSSINARPIKDKDAAVEEGREQAHRIQHEKTYENIERALNVYAKFQIDAMTRQRIKAKKIITLDKWLHPKT